MDAEQIPSRKRKSAGALVAACPFGHWSTCAVEPKGETPPHTTEGGLHSPPQRTQNRATGAVSPNPATLLSGRARGAGGAPRQPTWFSFPAFGQGRLASSPAHSSRPDQGSSAYPATTLQPPFCHWFCPTPGMRRARQCRSDKTYGGGEQHLRELLPWHWDA